MDIFQQDPIALGLFCNARLDSDLLLLFGTDFGTLQLAQSYSVIFRWK